MVALVESLKNRLAALFEPGQGGDGLLRRQRGARHTENAQLFQQGDDDADGTGNEGVEEFQLADVEVLLQEIGIAEAEGAVDEIDEEGGEFG